jgi:hypothetical protein
MARFPSSLGVYQEPNLDTKFEVSHTKSTESRVFSGAGDTVMLVN